MMSPNFTVMVFKQLAYVVFFSKLKHFAMDTDESFDGHICP